MKRPRGGFTTEDAREWANSHAVFGVSIRKTRRAAQKLPSEALPFMVDILAEGGPATTAAAAALHFNGAKIESDATEGNDPTWYRVTLSDGQVIFRQVESS